MSMSSAGRAENSNGCVTRPKGREIGLSGFAAQIQLYSLTGSYVMATAEHREPYESRGSRTVLGARGGEIPPRDSTPHLPSPHRACPQPRLTGTTSLEAATVALDLSGRWCLKASATSRRSPTSATDWPPRRKTHF